MLGTLAAVRLFVSLTLLAATGDAQTVVVSSITPSNGPTAGAITLTITGSNFPDDSSLRARIGQAEVTPVRVSASQLTLTAPQGFGAAQQVAVTFSVSLGQNGDATSSVLFAYDPPEITAVVPASIVADTQARTITVNGKNFGSSAATKPEILIANMPCNATTWVSDAQLSCTWSKLTENVQSPTEPLVALVLVRAGSQLSSSSSVSISFQPVSRTSSVYPDRGRTVGGEVITVYGNALLPPSETSTGTRVGFYDSNTGGLVGFSSCVQYIPGNAGMLYTLTPWGSGKDLIVKVRTNAYTSFISEARFSYSPPVVDAVCFLTATASIFDGEVRGMNFGVVNTSAINITIAGETYPGTWISDEKFSFSLPAAVASGKVTLNTCYNETGTGSATRRRGIIVGTIGAVGITVGTTDASTGSVTGVQTNEDILITRINPNTDNTRGSAQVTVHGFNFGANADWTSAGTGYVYFPNSGFSACVKWISSRQLIVSVPAGYGTGHVLVKIGDKSSEATNSARFSYNTPEIYTISPLGKTVKDTNVVVTIRGRYFGWRDSQPLIKIGDYTCGNEENVTEAGLTSTVRRGWVSDSELFCRITKLDITAPGQVTVEVGQVASGALDTSLVPGTTLSSAKSAYPIYFSFKNPRGIVLPTAPTSLAVSLSAGVGALRISWALPYNTGSGGNTGINAAKIQKYRVQVSTSSTFSVLAFDKDDQLPCSGTVGCRTSADATGLQVGVLYYVRVAAINEASQGPWARSSKIAARTPGKPTGVTAVVSGPQSVTVSFTRPTDTGAGGLEIPLVRYLVRMTRTITDSTPQIKDLPYKSSSASETLQFDGLVKGATYSVEVAAVNEISTSGYTTIGDAQKVRVASVPGVVSTPTLDRLSPDSITVAWMAPADFGFGSGAGNENFSLTGYEVAFATNEFTSSTDSGVQLRTLASTELSTTFTGLNTGQFYYFSVRATSAAGKGVWTDNLKLDAASAPSAPLDLTVSVASCPGAVVNWTAPLTAAFSNQGSTADMAYLKSYTVERADDAAFTSNSNIVSSSTTNLSTTLTNLVKGKIYYVRVRANNSFGWEGANTAATIQSTVTGATAPSSPQNVAVTAGHGSGVLTVTWTIPSDTGDGSERFPLVGFEVQYATASDFSGASSVQVTEPARRSQNILGLSSANTYYVRVFAKNACDRGSPSSSVTGTPVNTPSSPTSLTATANGDDVDLSWTLPSSSNVITSYRIAVKSDTDPAPSYYYVDDTTATNYKIMALKKGFKYTFDIAAGNRAGYSSVASTTLLFKTLGQISVSPSGGPVTASANVFLTGRVLANANTNSNTDAVSVTLNGVTRPASIRGDVKYESQSGGSAIFRMYATLSPPANGIPGLASVDVTVAGQTLKTTFLFGSVEPGQIAQMTPAVGPSKGGNTCAIVLRNFPYSALANDYSVNFNAPTGRRLLALVTSSSVMNAHAGDSLVTLQVTVPASTASGASSVSVKYSKDGKEVAAEGIYKYAAGSIVENVVPGSGSTFGGNDVMLHVRDWNSAGVLTGTLTTIGGATYTIGAVTKTQTGCSAGRFCYKFVAPAIAHATVTAKGTIMDAGTGTSITFDYEYYKTTPKLVSMTPATGQVDSTSNTVDLLMQGLDGNVISANDVSIDFGGVPSSGHLLTVNDNGFVVLHVTVPLSSVVKSVPVTVTLTKDAAISATSTAMYEYHSSTSAQVVEVLPASGPISGGAVISVRLVGTTYSTSVSATFQTPSGNTASGTNIEMVGSDTVLIQIPPSPGAETGLASVNLVVGSYTATFGFTYSAPVSTAATIDFVQPAQVAIGETVIVSLTNFNVVSKASDLVVTFGSSTVATVSNFQSSASRTTLFLTVPDYQSGRATINVVHASSSANAASAAVEVIRSARCAASTANIGWYNSSFGTSSKISTELESKCREQYSPYPTIVSYSPSVGYSRDKDSKAKVSVIVDTHLPTMPTVTMEVFDSTGSIAAFTSVTVSPVSGFSTRYMVTGTAPMVDRDETKTETVGILAIKSADPAVMLPFEFKLIRKPAEGSTQQNLAKIESISAKRFDAAGSQPIRVVLSNFVQISEATSQKTFGGRTVKSVTDVEVYVGSILCQVVAAKSGPMYTSLHFLTPPGPHQIGPARVTVQNLVATWNTASLAGEAGYYQSNAPSLEWVRPEQIPSTDFKGGAKISFSVELNALKSSVGKLYLQGQSEYPVIFKLDGSKTLNVTRNEIKMTQSAGKIFVTLTLMNDDVVIGTTVNNGNRFITIERTCNLPCQSLLDANQQTIRAPFSIISSPLNTNTPQVLTVSPNDLAANVRQQDVEVVVRGLSSSTLLTPPLVSAQLLEGAQSTSLTVTKVEAYAGPTQNEYYRVTIRINQELNAGTKYSIRVGSVVGASASFAVNAYAYDPYVKMIYPSQSPSCGGTDVTVVVQQFPYEVDGNKGYVAAYVGTVQVSIKSKTRNQATGDLTVVLTTPPQVTQVTTVRIMSNPTGQAGNPLYVATAIFTYTDMNVVAVSPSMPSGPVTGGSRVVFRIKDLGTMLDASKMSVSFGALKGLVLGVSAENNIRYSKVTVMAPAQPAGLVSGLLSTGSDVHPFLFEYKPQGQPSISSISPGRVSRAGGTKVELRVRDLPYLGAPDTYPELDIIVKVDGMAAQDVVIRRQSADYTDVVLTMPDLEGSNRRGFSSVPLEILIHQNVQDEAHMVNNFQMTLTSSVTSSILVGSSRPTIVSTYPKTVTAGELVQLVIDDLDGPIYSASQIGVAVQYGMWSFATELLYSRDKPEGGTTTAIMVMVPIDATAGDLAISVRNVVSAIPEAVTTNVQVESATQLSSPVEKYTSVSRSVNHKMFTYLLGQRMDFTELYTFAPTIRFVTPSSIPSRGTKTIYVGLRLRNPANYKFSLVTEGVPADGVQAVVSSREFSQICDYTYEANGAVACEMQINQPEGLRPTNCVRNGTTASGCLVDTVVLEFALPEIAMIEGMRTLKSELVIKPTSGTGQFKRFFTQTLHNDGDAQATMLSVLPSKVPMVGGSEVRMEIGEFNSGIAVLPSQVRVFVAGDEVKVLSVDNNAVRTVIIFVAPASTMPMLSGVVVPMNDAGRSVSFALNYMAGCDYSAFCGEEGVNKVMLARYPPSDSACMINYCVKSSPASELRYGASSSYTSAVAPVTVGVKFPVSVEPADLVATFGEFQGSVTRVTVVGENLAEITVMTPYVAIAQAVTMTLSSMSSSVGALSVPFQFYDKPAASDASVVSAMPNTGSMHGGTPVTLTISHFPMISSTNQLSITFNGVASTGIRILSSSVTQTVLVANTPSAAAGSGVISVSYLDGLVLAHTGTSSWTFTALDARVAFSYPQQAPYSTTSELLVSLTGFPNVASAADLTFTFPLQNTVVPALMLISSDASVTKAKVTVPVGGVGDVGVMQSVTVQLVSNPAYTANFPFSYSAPSQVTTLEWAEPTSAPVTGGTEIVLKLVNWIDDPSLDLSSIVVSFGNVRTTPISWLQSTATVGLLKVKSPVVGAAGPIRTQVYRIQDAEISTKIATFDYLFTEAEMTMDVKTCGNYHSCQVTTTIPNFNPSGTSSSSSSTSDWMVSFDGIMDKLSVAATSNGYTGANKALSAGGSTTLVFTTPISAMNGLSMGRFTYMPTGQTWPFTFTFTRRAEVVSILPRAQGSFNGGNHVQIKLQNFPVVSVADLGTQLSVVFGSARITPVILRSDEMYTVLKLHVPALAAASDANPNGLPVVSKASVPLKVLGPNGAVATSSFDYVPEAKITGVVPAYAPTYGGARITIAGTGFPIQPESALFNWETDVLVRFGDSYGKVLQVLPAGAQSASDNNAVIGDDVVIVVQSPPMQAGIVTVSIMVQPTQANTMLDNSLFYLHQADWSSSFAIYDKFSQVYTDSSFLTTARAQNIAGPWNPVQRETWSGVQGAAFGAATSIVIGDTSSTTVMVKNLPIAGSQDVVVKVGAAFASVVSYNSSSITIMPPTTMGATFMGAAPVPMQISYVGADGALNVALLPVMAYAAPKVLSATFDRGRARVIIRFDMNTNKAGASGSSIDCALVISSTVNLGINNNCIWTGSDVLVVNLGSGSNIAVGDRFSFVSGKLAAPGVAYSAASAGAFSSGMFALEDDAEVQSPVAVMVAPDQVGPCADIELTATGTTPMAGLQYFWGCSNDATVNEALLLQSGPQASISNAYLTKTNFAYKFTLMVKLAGVGSNVAETTVHRMGYPIVTTVLRGASVVKAGIPFSVEAVASFSGCPGETGTVVYEWSHVGLKSDATGESVLSRYHQISGSADPILTVPGQSEGIYKISLRAYLSADVTQISTTSLTVTVVPGPLSAAIFTGLPVGCETSRTLGEVTAGATSFKNSMDQCQRATTVSSKKVGFDMPILLTPVTVDPSKDDLHTHQSVTGVSKLARPQATKYQCRSASGIPCKGFGSQRPQYNPMGFSSGIEHPVMQKFFTASLATNSVMGTVVNRTTGKGQTVIESGFSTDRQFAMLEVQPYNAGSADNNPFVDTDVFYNEPLYITATIADPATSRSATAMTTVQFAPVAGMVKDFLLTALSGIYIDDSGMPYMRPNEGGSFTVASGRQPDAMAVTWSWQGDNVPGVVLTQGPTAEIPAQSLKPGVMYTLRAAPRADQSDLFYDEITFYVDTPPTRGTCSAAMTGAESTVTVTCSDFSVPGGTDGFPAANPTEGQLLYQYGYYDTTGAGTWQWFSTTPEPTMSYCIPAGSIEPWVKIINFKGSATFTKALFATVTGACNSPAVGVSATDCYTAVAPFTDSSSAYNGVNGNNVGGKYQAWGQLGRIDLLSQCASVWAGADHSGLGATTWTTNVNDLVAYTSAATYSTLLGRNPSVGMTTLMAAEGLSKQQRDLITANSAEAVNTPVAATLCTVSGLGLKAVQSIKSSSDLATVRSISLAPYQYYPLSVAISPVATNMTAAMGLIGAVAQTNKKIVTAPAPAGVVTESTACGLQTARNLGVLGELAAVSVVQGSITAAALPRRVSNGPTFALHNAVIETTDAAVSYDAFVLNAYYDVNSNEAIFNARASRDKITYTGQYVSESYTSASNLPASQLPPYVTTESVASATRMLPTFFAQDPDINYLNSSRSGSFVQGATYAAATFRATGLANMQSPYMNYRATGYGANAPNEWPAGESTGTHAGKKDFFINYRAFEAPNNWNYTRASTAMVSNGVYGYTVYPALHYNDAVWTDELRDLWFGKVQGDASLIGPIEIVIPVTGTGTQIDRSTVACASQDLETGVWSTEFACASSVPTISMRPWSSTGRVNPGCIVSSTTATTVTCHCWSSPRLNVLVQKYDHASLCPGCDGIAGSQAVKDLCGVCGGNGSTCVDCNNVPNGTAVADDCGVCGGDGSTCRGCDGIIGSPKKMDVCGVCDGKNDTCLGCTPVDGFPDAFPLPIPLGGKVLDACGVCGGDGSSCAGCDNVPYSGKKFDKCGICGGNSNTSYPQFGQQCVGKFITPAAMTRLVVTAGNEVTLIVKAKASDNANMIQLDTTTTTPGMQSMMRSYKRPEGKSVQVGENITFTWTWTPKFYASPMSGNPPVDQNEYKVCLKLTYKLPDGNDATADSRCFLISVVFCQHVAGKGDTLKTIAKAQFGDEKRSRTLWWLNPSVEYMDQVLAEGMRIEIGRRFAVAANDTLKYYVNEFGSSYANVAAQNPLRMHYLQGGRNFKDGVVVEEAKGKPVADIMFHNYHRQVTYDGTEFCIVSEMDSFSRY